MKKQLDVIIVFEIRPIINNFSFFLTFFFGDRTAYCTSKTGCIFDSANFRRSHNYCVQKFSKADWRYQNKLQESDAMIFFILITCDM